MANPEPPRLENQSVGNLTPFVIVSTSRGAAKNPTAVRAVGYDPKKTVKGTATSAGSTSTLSDSAATWTNDQPNGLLIRIRTAASGKPHEARITDYDSATDTYTFTTLSEAVGNGDEYEVVGWPLMALATATVSTNETTINATQALHAYVGPRRLAVEFTFSATEVRWVEWEYEVVD